MVTPHTVTYDGGAHTAAGTAKGVLGGVPATAWSSGHSIHISPLSEGLDTAPP